MSTRQLLSTITLLPILFVPTSHAFNQRVPHEKTYLLRVTASDNHSQHGFNASYMAINQDGTKMNKFEQKTPYEQTIKANFLGILIESEQHIQMDIAEIDDHHVAHHVTASGHEIFAKMANHQKSYIVTN